MSNPNYTAVLFVLDVSGSMGGRYEFMEDAMHMMLEQQARKLAGYITVDIGYFDDSAYMGEVDADPMTVHLSMYAGGGTQIYDTTAAIVKQFQARLDALPEHEQPGHVVVIIASDGESSPPNTDAGYKINHQISALTKAGWDFAFLAAGANLTRVMQTMGMDSKQCIQEDFTPKGMERMAERLGAFISMTRAGERAHF